MQTHRIAPLLIFIAAVISTLTSDLDNKILYIAASAIVLIGVVVAFERLVKRPHA